MAVLSGKVRGSELSGKVSEGTGKIEEDINGVGDESEGKEWGEEESGISEITGEGISVPEDSSKVQVRRGMREGQGEDSGEENDVETEPSSWTEGTRESLGRFEVARSQE